MSGLTKTTDPVALAEILVKGNVRGLTMYGVDIDLIAEHGEEFDELLDECNSKIPFGDFAYTYSECYKKVDPVAYGMALYDWIDSKMEALNG